jgi:hypothetical protein
MRIETLMRSGAALDGEQVGSGHLGFGKPLSDAGDEFFVPRAFSALLLVTRQHQT